MKLGLGLRLSINGAVPDVFSAASVPNLAAWYNAADTASITASSGAVSQWNDKSGNGYHATQTGAGNKPTTGIRTLNGKNVLKFDGGDALILPAGLNAIPNGNNTVFMVVALDNTSSDQRPLTGAGSSGTRWGILFNTPAGNFSVTNNSTATFSAQPKTFDLLPHIVGLRKNAGNITSLYDGTPSNNIAANDFSAIECMIGARTAAGDSGLNGVIAEILIYSATLTPAQCNIVTTYLADKWALTWNGLAVSGAPFAPISSMAAFGDSITEGLAASTTENRWSVKLSRKLNAGLLNKGISSTVLQNTTGAANNGRNRYAADLTGVNKRDFATVLYGLNDAAFTASGTTVTAYKTQYLEIVDGLMAAGYPRDNILVMAPTWVPDAFWSISGISGSRAVLEQYVAAAREVAVARNLFYTDTYAYMRDNGGAALMDGDNIHPNDAGHTAIYNAALAATKVT